MQIQMIKKYLLKTTIVFLVLLFSGCGSSVYNYSTSDKVLSLGQKSDQILNIKLTNPILRYHTAFRCVNRSYTLRDINKEYGKLFIEYIDLNSSCNWNGLASGFFETNLRYELKLNSFEVVEEFDIGTYNFKTYKIDNQSYLNMIYIYGASEKFILDYNGLLYDKLLKSFKPEYKNEYLFKERFKGDYNDSLVRKNLINNYFSPERRYMGLGNIGFNLGIILSL